MGQDIYVSPDGHFEEKTLSIPYAFYNEAFGFAAAYAHGKVGYPQKQSAILGTVMAGTKGSIMGFVIGISVLRMNWALHGVILGSLIGSLFILYEAILGYPMWIWAGLLIPGNAAYGFFSELFTTKVFNAPVNK